MVGPRLGFDRGIRVALICQWPLSVQAIASECAPSRTSGCHGLPSREVTRATRPRPGVPCSLLQVRTVTGTILLLPARGRSRFRFSAGGHVQVSLVLVLVAGEAGPGQVREPRRLPLSGRRPGAPRRAIGCAKHACGKRDSADGLRDPAPSRDHTDRTSIQVRHIIRIKCYY